MATAVKGTKALLAGKASTAVTEYTSGAAVAPAAGTLAVYLDMGDGDEHRAVEIETKLQTLIDRARESDYMKPTEATLYFRCPLNGSKQSIEATTDRLDIIEGDVAIGISASVRAGENGSILFDSCFHQIIDKMWEQWGSVDATPSILVNTGAAVDEGDSVVITSDMLSATDADSYNPDLIFTVTSGPANGQLEDVGDEGTEITTFTQQDLEDGIVQYVHDDSDTESGDFGFSVSDGTTSLTGQTFEIVVTLVED